MILGGEKKKIASLIVSRMKPSASPAGPEEGEGASKDAGLLSASEEIMSAIHAKDAQGLLEALKSFLEMSEGSEEEGEKAPEGSEE